MENIFLKEVILRLDFLSPIDVLEKIDSKLIIEITKYFKKAKPKSVFIVNNDENNKNVQWTFISDDGSQLTIGNNVILYSTKVYVSYRNTIEDRILNIVLKTLFDIYSPHIRRIGLRYTNRVSQENEKLIDNSILYYKDYFKDYGEIISSICAIRIDNKFEDFDMNYRIQLGHTEEKGLIENERFILDIDGYNQNTIYDFTSMSKILNNIHDQIKVIYKKIING